MMRVFFFNDTATTEIYTLSLHDALPIWRHRQRLEQPRQGQGARAVADRQGRRCHLHGRRQLRPRRLRRRRSEEHTSELQSRQYLVCRLLLEKKHRPFISTSLTVSPLALT